MTIGEGVQRPRPLASIPDASEEPSQVQSSMGAASQFSLSLRLILLLSLPSRCVSKTTLQSILNINLCLRVRILGDLTCASPDVRNKQHLGQHRPIEISAMMALFYSHAMQ